MAKDRPRVRKHDLRCVVGDVFAGPVSDGRFGAVRVVRIIKDGARPGRDSGELVCTRYLGGGPPRASDPALGEVLRRRRFKFHGEAATTIFDEPPPANFVHVGNFAITKEEKALRRANSYGQSWQLVEESLMEWKWANAREAFVREVDDRASSSRVSAPPSPRRRTARSSLNEDDFWRLIDSMKLSRDAKAPCRTDDELVEPLIVGLAARPVADIREFQELLAHKLYLLDEERFARHAGDAGDSDDAFLYARCYVVGRGRRFYEGVAKAPRRFPADVELEVLLTAAAEAYLRRTGNDYDETTHYSYETGSNAAGWPPS